jgi:hypothetical protein
MFKQTNGVLIAAVMSTVGKLNLLQSKQLKLTMGGIYLLASLLYVSWIEPSLGRS